MASLYIVLETQEYVGILVWDTNARTHICNIFFSRCPVYRKAPFWSKCKYPKAIFHRISCVDFTSVITDQSYSHHIVLSMKCTQLENGAVFRIVCVCYLLKNMWIHLKTMKVCDFKSEFSCAISCKLCPEFHAINVYFYSRKYMKFTRKYFTEKLNWKCSHYNRYVTEYPTFFPLFNVLQSSLSYFFLTCLYHISVENVKERAKFVRLH